MSKEPNCQECPLAGAPVIRPSAVNRGANLIVCGEGPGPVEEEVGRYFAGWTGDFLADMLVKYKIPRTALHFTNATMCRPKRSLGRTEWTKALECCKPRLQHELSQIKGKVVLAYGKQALKAFTGRDNIFSWAGAPIGANDDFRKLTVIATLHPSFCAREGGRAYTPSVFIHSNRAWQLACGELEPWVWPRIITEPTQEALEVLEGFYRNHEEVGFDIETQGLDPMVDPCMCLALGAKEVAVCVPWEGYTAGKFGIVPGIDETPTGKKIQKLIIKILEHPEIPKVFQNGQHDILGMEKFGIHIQNYAFDTLYAHALVSPGTRHDLGWMSCVETYAPRWKEEQHSASSEKGAKKFIRRNPTELRTYCAKDAWMTRLDKDLLSRRLQDMNNGMKLLKEVYMEGARIAVKMRRKGFKVDLSAAKVHRVRLQKRRGRAGRAVVAFAKELGFESFNPRSNAQLKALFFGKLGIEPYRVSELSQSPCLDEEALTNIAGEPNVAAALCARALLKFRKTDKIVQVIDKLRQAPAHICHPSWGPGMARTFRWACSGPNLMNVPKPLTRTTKKGKNVVVIPGLRDLFIPHDKEGWIVCADADQLELRIMALLAGDEPLLTAFAEGKDPHTMNAQDLFGVSAEEVTKAMRNMAKMAAYQMNYGGDPNALWQKLIVDFPNITLLQCQRMHHNWFTKHKAIKDYHNYMIRFAREMHFIEAPLTGHRLYFYTRIDTNKIYNYPIQHTAADIINPAVIATEAKIDWEKEAVLAQVHDEIVVCGPDPMRLAKVLKENMTRTIKLNGRTMVFTVGLKIGRNWGELVEIKAKDSVEEKMPAVMKEAQELYERRQLIYKRLLGDK